MNQPTRPVPPQRVRPQLFGAPRARGAGHSDFGPSILATIDGGAVAEPRQHTSRPRVWLWAVVVLLTAGAVYQTGAVLSERRVSPPGIQPASTLPAVSRVVVDAASAPTGLPVHASTGAASIETVSAALVPSTAPAASTPATTNDAAAHKQAVSAAPVPAGERRAEARPVSRSSTGPSANKPTKPTIPGDTDADLLAAMLPHVKRQGAVTVPAASSATQR